MIFVILNQSSPQDYIHREGVCHRDLKPENIMLDAAGVLKISDFGLCSVYKLKESGKTRLLSERCGSLPYIAPEVSVPQLFCARGASATFKLAGNAPYKAEPIDVWGIGVILFTMLVGSKLFLPIVRIVRSNSPQTHLGTSRRRRVSSFALTLTARFSIRIPGTGCPRRCSVRRFNLPGVQAVLIGDRLDKANVEHQSRRQTDDSGCPPTPVGVTVSLSAMLLGSQS